MPILALANRKGGVAKTTSTVNIAAELTAAGYRVLCCDLDPQASLTLIAGLVPDRLPDEQTALAALLPELVEPDPDRLCAPAPWGGELMPANQHLANAEVALTAGSAAGPHQRLAIALEELAGRYDFVLVDSPPSMGKLVLNAICACDHLLVPVAADYVSVGGLDRLLEVVEQVRRFERKELSILGVFATQARRTLHSRETLELLGDLSGETMMQTVIPQAVAIQDAQAAHQAVRDFAPGSRGTEAYRQLTEELLARLNSAHGERKAA